MQSSATIASLSVLGLLLGACAPAAVSPAAPTAPCAGISDADIASTLQTVRANVESVRAKNVTDFESKGVPAQRLLGAVVEVRATPGMSGPWLTRVLQCDASRTLASGGAAVDAREDGAHYKIAIESRDPAVAQGDPFPRRAARVRAVSREGSAGKRFRIPWFARPSTSAGGAIFVGWPPKLRRF